MSRTERLRMIEREEAELSLSGSSLGWPDDSSLTGRLSVAPWPISPLSAVCAGRPWFGAGDSRDGDLCLFGTQHLTRVRQDERITGRERRQTVARIETHRRS